MMTASYELRQERADDHAEVRRVVVEAFTSSDYGYQGEADLVEELRARHEDRIAYVACESSRVVGHVLLTPATLRSNDAANECMTLRGMGLAPLAVAPDRKGIGVGSALTDQALAQAFSSGTGFVLVLGSGAFYQRFGFASASEMGIAHGFAGMPQEAFYIRFAEDVDPRAWANSQAFYSPVFGPQHAEPI
ncbi:MAG: N-acetyltransferase [Planctomycetales bacterium]|nr:N-acetyltransferase [Planctomycetales bacterium]